MFGFCPTENGRGMAHQDEQPNIESVPQDARPDDPDKRSPRGNGDRDERDTERGLEKLDSVLGQ
jgi:hypothetical protein